MLNVSTASLAALFAQADGYEWGWSTWVAIGTVLLACGTGWLAFTTRGVAKATRAVAEETTRLASETTELAKRTAEDVAAQFRPAIVSAAPDPNNPPLVLNEEGLQVEIHNSGHGPALNIDARAHPGNVVPRLWHHATLPTGTTKRLLFPAIEPDSDGIITIEMEYGGLGRERYRSRLVVDCQKELTADEEIALLEQAEFEMLTPPVSHDAAQPQNRR